MCIFSRGKAGPGPLPGGGNGKSCCFSGGVSKTGANVLRYVKLRPQEHFFTPDCNVICRSYCNVTAMKICDTATPIHGAMVKFADR